MSAVGQVLRRLVYSQLIFGLLLGGVPTFIIYVTKYQPRKQHFNIFDATISGAPKDTTVLGVTAVLISLGLAVAQIAVSEFVLMADARPTLVAKWTHTLQAIINLFAGFMYQICVQQATAVFVGKMRPEFISKCEPSPAAYNKTLPNFNPAGVKGYRLWPSDVCTADDYRDAMKSFPSGHSSSTSMLTCFGFLYLLYTWYCRRPKCYADEWQHHHGFTRAWQDVRLGLAGVFIFAQFVWIWFVGISRYIDNKHHIEDIIGGWLLGALFATLFVMDAFGREYRMNMPCLPKPEDTFYSEGETSAQVGDARLGSERPSDPVRVLPL